MTMLIAMSSVYQIFKSSWTAWL